MNLELTKFEILMICEILKDVQRELEAGKLIVHDDRIVHLKDTIKKIESYLIKD